MIACMAFSLMPLAAFATEGEAGEAVVCEQHSFDNGVCTVCEYVCPHENVTDGVCADCGVTVPQEQTITQDDNGTPPDGNNAKDDNGTPDGNDTPDGSDTPDDNGENKAPVASQTGENGTEGETGETANAVAKIGETKYATLAEAVGAMKDGDTVTLLDYVTENVIFNKNGTIDLGFYSITGAVTVQANVTFTDGSVNQGDTANAAIVINSGSLTLDETTVTGDNGISVETTGAVSVIVGSNSKITGTEGYGIRQTVVKNESKGTLNVICKMDSNIDAKTVGVEIKSGSYTAESDMDVMDRIECPGAVVLKIDEGSYNIGGGMFIGDFSFGEGVTGSITGGLFSFDPTSYLKDEYIIVERDTLYEVVKGTKVGDAYVYTETVNEKASTVSAVDEVTVADAPAKTEGAGSAINKEAVLSKAAGFETGDNVEINVSLKAEVKEAAKDTNGAISSATYSLTPEITLNVKGETDTQTIPYDASMLNSSEITVTVPLVNGFVPETIVHIHADGSADMYKKGSAASLTEFVVNADNTVSFKVTSFSDFVMYAQTMSIEVLDRNEKFSAAYNDLAAAVAAVEDNGTVKLLGGITSGEVTVNTRAFTLDLAGQTLTLTAAIQMADNGNITIKDSSTGGKITGTTPAISVNSRTAGVTIESGTVTGGIKLNANGELLIYKTGVVEGAPAVDASAGVVTIEGGTVTGTDASKPAINVTGSATLILEQRNDGVISVTNASGTAIEINGANDIDAQFRMESGTVKGGTTGVNVLRGDVTINGGAIEGATAINAAGGSVTITGGTFDSTSATQEVTKSGTATVKVFGGSFKHAVPSDQCPDGYVPSEDSKNATRYSVALMVAQSTTAGGVTTKHPNVQAAIDAAGEGGTVTLLADSSDSANAASSMTIDGSGKKMGTLNVNAAAEVTVKNLKADTVRVGSASATADFSGASTEIGKLENSGTVSISEGRYKTIGGTGTYSITGGLFGIKVDDKWCAKIPVSGKTEGTASSLTKYTAVANTDPATKDEYPYMVTVAPAPRITKISNSAYFQRNSNGTLTIYTDRTVDELVKNTNSYQQDQYPYRCLTVTSANGTTNIITPRYYTVTADDNGNAVITISNEFLKYRTVGTYSVQVEYTTGVTQWETFRVGTSPKTGDESNIGLWIGIMACSVIIIGCGAFVLIHKSKKNKK